jgi:hypothetical protein
MPQVSFRIDPQISTIRALRRPEEGVSKETAQLSEVTSPRGVYLLQREFQTVHSPNGGAKTSVRSSIKIHDTVRLIINRRSPLDLRGRLKWAKTFRMVQRFVARREA